VRYVCVLTSIAILTESASECPRPTSPNSFASSPVVAAGRIQKTKPRKSLSNVTPSHVQRVFDGDSSNVSQASNLRNESVTSASSDTSSNVPSLASSSSSTPRIDAVDMGVPRNDSFQQVSTPAIKDEANHSRIQIGTMGAEGYRLSTGDLGWTDEWSEYGARPASTTQRTLPSAPSCCQPQTIPEEPIEMALPSSCCAPTANTQPGFSGDARHDSHQPISQNLRHMSGDEHTGFGTSTFNNPMNLGMNFTEPFEFGAASFNSVPQGLDFFGELEGRDGCGSHVHIPGQLNGRVDGHNCHCGEGCDCLGCATHPANRTTTEYVRYHNAIASRGYPIPSRMQAPLGTFQQHSQYGTPNAQGQYSHVHPVGMPNVQQDQLTSRFNQTYGPAPTYGVPSNSIPSWQLGSQIPVLTPTNELQQFHIHTPSQMAPAVPQPTQLQFQNEFHGPRSQQGQSLKSERNITNSAGKAPINNFEPAQRNRRDPDLVMDHESPSTDDDNSTLSPSSIHIQQFKMPGCNDVTGTCQCGDGCQCPGCLTHVGHGEYTENDIATGSARPVNRGSARTGRAPDLNGFSVDNFHHVEMFPTTAPG
jgi:hypothetical protein